MSAADFILPGIAAVAGWVLLSLAAAIWSGKRATTFGERATGNLIASSGLWSLLWLFAVAVAATRTGQLSWWVAACLVVLALVLMIGVGRALKHFTVTRRWLAAASLRDF